MKRRRMGIRPFHLLWFAVSRMIRTSLIGAMVTGFNAINVLFVRHIIPFVRGPTIGPPHALRNRTTPTQARHAATLLLFIRHFARSVLSPPLYSWSPRLYFSPGSNWRTLSPFLAATSEIRTTSQN